MTEVLGGVHFEFDCDLTLGEVVHDYLTEEVDSPVAARAAGSPA